MPYVYCIDLCYSYLGVLQIKQNQECTQRKEPRNTMLRLVFLIIVAFVYKVSVFIIAFRNMGYIYIVLPWHKGLFQGQYQYSERFLWTHSSRWINCACECDIINQKLTNFIQLHDVTEGGLDYAILLQLVLQLVLNIQQLQPSKDNR